MNPLLKQALPVIAVAATLLLWRCQSSASQRALGAAFEHNAILSDSLSIARAEGRKIDSVFQRDTLRLTRLLTRTDTVIRTLFRTDTVTLTRRESVLVFVADSLVRSCRESLTSCAQRIGNLNEQLSLVTQQRNLWQRRAQPSLWDQVKQLPGRAVTSTALMSVGYAACKIGGM